MLNGLSRSAAATEGSTVSASQKHVLLDCPATVGVKWHVSQLSQPEDCFPLQFASDAPHLQLRVISYHVVYPGAATPERSIAKLVCQVKRCSQMCNREGAGRLGTRPDDGDAARDIVREGRGCGTCETWAGAAHNPEVAGSNPAPAT